MGRWSHLDTDEERLPEGMTRVGYDADTQVYTYRDSDGSYWEGAPGCQYGKLHRVRSATPPLPSVVIPTDIQGDEQPYVLYDRDDDDSNFDEHLKEGIHGGGDEKTLGSKGGTFVRVDDVDSGLATPDKARLHTLNNPHHPGLGKKLPDLPDGADSMSGTTVVGIPYETRPGGETRPQTGLKRSGTLSRIARFLSGSSSSSPAARPQRRATVAGRNTAAARGHRDGNRDAKLARASTASGAAGTADRWPGQGTDPASRWKRATTFDEILGTQ
ncbi:hypothetical protein VTI74DRAFT_9295 [Chaetomium olivicolor]